MAAAMALKTSGATAAASLNGWLRTGLAIASYWKGAAVGLADARCGNRSLLLCRRALVNRVLTRCDDDARGLRSKAVAALAVTLPRSSLYCAHQAFLLRFS